MRTNQRLPTIIVSRWSNQNLWRDHVTWQLARGIHTSIVRNGYLTLKGTIVNLRCNIQDHDLVSVVFFVKIVYSNSSPNLILHNQLVLTNLEDVCRYFDILQNGVNFTDNWQKKKQLKARWLSCFSRQWRAVQGSRKWRKRFHTLYNKNWKPELLHKT